MKTFNDLMEMMNERGCTAAIEAGDLSAVKALAAETADLVQAGGLLDEVWTEAGGLLLYAHRLWSAGLTADDDYRYLAGEWERSK